MSENSDSTYYQKNRDVILNRAKDYFENDKERLREQARNKYRSLSEEEKYKERENMLRIDIRICLKKRIAKKIIKKIIVIQRSVKIRNK